jgi:hypothetical protein
MASFTKKIFGLAGAATVFAGMAFGQSTCAQTSTTNIIRAEGTTEQVAPINITCTGTGVAGTASLQVFLSPALPVTSKVTSTTTGATEAVAVVGATTVQGTVSGSTINFSGIAIPAGTFTITISNVRVNASSLTVGSGVPPAISATSFISGSAGSIVPAALGAVQVAFAQNGLGTVSLFKDFPAATAGPNSGFVVCRAFSPVASAANSLIFTVRVNENFASAFKAVGSNVAPVAPGEVSTVAVGTSNAVLTGTRLTLSLGNIPTGVTLYVPTDLISSATGGGKIRLTNAAAGAVFAAVTPSTATAVAAAGNYASVSGTATFEVINDDQNTLDRYDIPVYAVSTINGPTASATAITAGVSFAPTGSTVIPNFVASSAAPLVGPAFSACSTSLLFPFVTNQLGFDTGIAISNTSSDPFGTTRGATPQAGTCSLNFYGAGAPSPANVTTPNVPTGTTYTQVLSGVAAGFQGYLIAQCNFQYAHGFAFVTNGVGVNGGLSQGYLAGVIPDTNQKNRNADPSGVALAGTGETLGN